MSAPFQIAVAGSEADRRAAFPVMRALRPHLESEADFLDRVRAQEGAGYRLALLREGDAVRAVAGFRLSENLAWGRFLYVDDLVTAPEARSRGCGAALLTWLAERARAEGCAALHLDSGTWRTDAHRFYEREEMEVTSLHFARRVVP